MPLIFIIELRDETLPKARQVNAALRSELPAAFPDYEFEFAYPPGEGEGGGIIPLIGTAGDAANPGRKYEEQATSSDLRELRLRAYETSRKPSPGSRRREPSSRATNSQGDQ